jgi:hypothetical protein
MRGLISMHFEINVSLDGKHFFATHDRSIQDIEKCKRVYSELADRFPKSEGFNITITKWESHGTIVRFD